MELQGVTHGLQEDVSIRRARVLSQRGKVGAESGQAFCQRLRLLCGQVSYWLGGKGAAK
jgi:hypothetical protein